MLQKLRCIRFGEVLLDENKQALLLCSNCKTDYRELQTFRQHLEHCNGLEQLIQQNITIAFDSDKGRRLTSGYGDTLKEYQIYEPSEVMKVEMSTATKAENLEMDLIKIEEELLDPKWYSDLTTITPEPQDKILHYKELVEAVTPYVQFKENLRGGTNTSSLPRAAKSNNNNANSKTPAPMLHVHLKPPKLETSPPAQQQQKGNTPRKSTAAKKNRVTGEVANQMVRKLIINKPLETKPAPQLKTQSQNIAELVNSRQNEIKKFVPGTVVNAGGAPKSMQSNLVDKVSVANAGDKNQKKKPAQDDQKVYPTALIKRRQTVSISMDNAMIDPEFKNQFITNNNTNSSSSSSTSSSASNNINKFVKKVLPGKLPQKTAQSTKTVPVEKQQPSAAAAKQATTLQVGTPTTAKEQQPKQQKQQPQPIASSTITPAKSKQQTEQIINKLQTLGLQVKRTHPAPELPASKSSTRKTDDKTMELLKKLQSKGMKVQIINKNTNSGNVSKTKLNATQTRPTTQAAAAASQPQPQNKTLINRNLIIKKVK